MTQIDASRTVFDTLCPMHLVINASGHILHCGPTLSKLRAEAFEGRRFLEVFELKRPRNIKNMKDLKREAGTKLHLKFRDAPQTELKGVAVPGLFAGEMVINLSFGISVVDGVRDYNLTHADFAATDLTVEMLYLVEAKSAAMEASRMLNLRLQGAKIAAEEQAFTDTLTGLKNRRAINHVLNRHLHWGTQFALMQVDLDWFKAVNDTLGHAAGDHVLQHVARIMVEETREHDTVARVGGDEFVIVLPKADDECALRAIGERIIERLQKPIRFQDDTCSVSASIGVAIQSPGANSTIEDLMDDADVALYASKRAGRGCQTFYSPALRGADTAQTAPKGRTAQA